MKKDENHKKSDKTFVTLLLKELSDLKSSVTIGRKQHHLAARSDYKMISFRGNPTFN